MEKDFLYKKIKILDEIGYLIEAPLYLERCLSSRIELRGYQKKAFEYFITYCEDKNGKLRNNKQIHNLFHMATGERVIIVMGAVCVIKSRVPGTLDKYISCIA